MYSDIKVALQVSKKFKKAKHTLGVSSERASGLEATEGIDRDLCSLEYHIIKYHRRSAKSPEDSVRKLAAFAVKNR